MRLVRTEPITLKGLKKIWPDIVDMLAFLPDEKKPSFMVAAIFGVILKSYDLGVNCG